MAWSTRELAVLAGTTVRAVRHYHQVGLLEEPRRRANGYKQYGVAHLVRVLRITRLAALGFALPQIAELAELADTEPLPQQALSDLDTRLTDTLDRLERTRAELRRLRKHATPIELPPALAPQVHDADLPATDRSLLVVMSRVLDPAVVGGFIDTVRSSPRSRAAVTFADLPADADETARRDLAIDLASVGPSTSALLPLLWAVDRGTDDDARGTDDDARKRAAAARTVDGAVGDIYSPAQLDVLHQTQLAIRCRSDRQVPALDTKSRAVGGTTSSRSPFTTNNGTCRIRGPLLAGELERAATAPSIQGP